MHRDLKQKAIDLRVRKQMSYGDILKHVPVAKSTLSVWLKDLPLSEERMLELRRNALSRNETKIELFRAAMRRKKEQKDKDVYERYLRKFRKISKNSFFVAGLMLYLAEGSKTNTSKIALANTDPRVCKFFMRWLGEFYGIGLDRVKVHLQLYEAMDMSKEMKFWEDVLGISKSQFYKHFIRKPTGFSFSYRESFRHGTCTVIVLGVQIYREVMMAIKAYLQAADMGV